jgi:hypothetical protein
MSLIDRPVPPRLPDPPTQEVTASFFAVFSSTLRLYFNRLSGVLSALLGTGGAIELQMPHAMLMSDEDQMSAGTTVANIVTYNQPVIEQGIEVRNGGEIWFEKPGQYLVTFTLQVTNRDNQDHLFEVWAKYNGTNYPLSNTRFDVPQRKSASEWGHIVPAITGIFTVEDPTNDYLSIAWWSDSTLVFLQYYPAQTSPTRPEIPSVILTVQGVSRLPITP